MHSGKEKQQREWHFWPTRQKEPAENAGERTPKTKTNPNLRANKTTGTPQKKILSYDTGTWRNDSSLWLLRFQFHCLAGWMMDSVKQWTDLYCISMSTIRFVGQNWTLCVAVRLMSSKCLHQVLSYWFFALWESMVLSSFRMSQQFDQNDQI